MEASKVNGHRVSTSRMLRVLGVSRSGYRAFLSRKVSPSRQRKETVKKEIQKIYDESKQNYGAHKIAKKLRDSGEIISTRTVGKYMRKWVSKLNGLSPGLLQPEILISATSLTMFSMNSLILIVLTLSGVPISRIFGHRKVLFISTALWICSPG